MAEPAYLDFAGAFGVFLGSNLPNARSSASGDSSAPTSRAISRNRSSCLAVVSRFDCVLALAMAGV